MHSLQILLEAIPVFFILLCIAILYSVLSLVLIRGIMLAYYTIQYGLLKRSGQENKFFVEKLLIIFYKLQKRLLYFVTHIRPFRLCISETDNFIPRLFVSGGRNVFVVLLLYCLAIIIILFQNNYDIGREVVRYISDSNTILRVWSFISGHIWFILALLSTLALFYSAFKDKFIDKIITEIQDEELISIIKFHKSILGDCVNLRESLCKNIDRFLTSRKNNGIIVKLQDEMEKKFPLYGYCEKEKTFIKNTKDLWRFNGIPATSFGYEITTDILQRIKEKLKEFEKASPFYSTAALNKYIHGLNGFDVTYFIYNTKYDRMLDEIKFKELCTDYSDQFVDMICGEDIDKDKIEALNKALKNRSEEVISLALNAIEAAIDIDLYIRKFEKAFALKRRRKGVPLEQIIEKYR